MQKKKLFKILSFSTYLKIIKIEENFELLRVTNYFNVYFNFKIKENIYFTYFYFHKNKNSKID